MSVVPSATTGAVSGIRLTHLYGPSMSSGGRISRLKRAVRKQPGLQGWHGLLLTIHPAQIRAAAACTSVKHFAVRAAAPTQEANAITDMHCTTM